MCLFLWTVLVVKVNSKSHIFSFSTSAVLVKRAEFVCGKKFSGGRQKKKFMDMDWRLQLDPDEMALIIAVENFELKSQVCLIFSPRCIGIRVAERVCGNKYYM